MVSSGETCKFFNERIPVNCSFKPNLWPCHRIGHHFDISIDNFLPRVTLSSAFLSKASEHLSKGNFNAIRHSISHSDIQAEITCTDLTMADKMSEGLGRVFVKTQGYQQEASTLQITKDDLLTYCEDVRTSMTVHQKPNKPQSSLQAILNLESTEPSLFDYLKLAYIFSYSHEFLLKIMAIVPNLTVSLRPIKGFPAINNAVLKRVFSQTGNGFETGLLTLDREHRIVLIDSDDANCKTYPLVGLWITGLNSNGDKKALKDARVIAAIMRFLFSDDIKLRIGSGRKESKRSFILVNFVESMKISPQFFEFELPEKDKSSLNNWMLLEGSCEVKRDKRGRFSPVQMQLTCRQDFNQTVNYSVYRLSQILCSLPLSKSKYKGKENTNPFSAKLQMRTKDPLSISQAKTKTHFTNTETRTLQPKFPVTFEDLPEHSTIDSMYNLKYCADNQEEDYSNDESEEQLMQVVMENSKSIQMMQQFVMQLTQQLMEIKSSVPSEPTPLSFPNNKEGNVSFSIDASSIEPKYYKEEGQSDEIDAQNFVEQPEDEPIHKPLNNPFGQSKEGLVEESKGNDRSISVPRIVDIDLEGREVKKVKIGGYGSYLNVMLYYIVE